MANGEKLQASQSEHPLILTSGKLIDDVQNLKSEIGLYNFVWYPSNGSKFPIPSKPNVVQKNFLHYF